MWCHHHVVLLNLDVSINTEDHQGESHDPAGGTALDQQSYGDKMCAYISQKTGNIYAYSHLMMCSVFYFSESIHSYLHTTHA